MAVSRILSGPQLSPEPGRPFVLPRAFRSGQPLRAATITRRSPSAFASGSGRQPGSSCSVLHRMGFFVPPGSRPGRWALTPPFHPCLQAFAGRRSVFCDTFRRPEFSLRPPARFTRHAALWCPDFPLSACLPATGERPSAIGREPTPGRRPVQAELPRHEPIRPQEISHFTFSGIRL